MRLFLLTTLTMIAFAANSVLNRLAVGAGAIDPAWFALVRLAAGAGVLLALVWFRHGRAGVPVWPGGRGRVVGSLALLTYLFGFSAAYGALSAGHGALVLFGTVQITMFAGAILTREAVPAGRWTGAVVAFAGLVLLLAPGGGVEDLRAAGAMVFAGVGWGVYSLSGRGQADALAGTAWNFALALPFGVVLTLGLARSGLAAATPEGIALAVLSGAVTSGLGYALWYRILPDLGAGRAAVAQLTVPVIAAAAGLMLLGEGIGLRFVLAIALVLGGVALAVRAGRA